MAASRAALRRLLGRVMAVPPEHVPIRVEPSGRPTVAGGPAFSTARDGRIVVIGLAARPGTRIGVDVVSPPSGWRASDLAPTVLDPAEQGRLVGLSTRDADRLVLRMWSLKEARLKGTGVGLWIEPATCTTRLLDASRALVAAPDGTGTWPADSLLVGSSVVSVAWHGAG
jgi:4'-phosphopantetheinyl transferase